MPHDHRVELKAMLSVQQACDWWLCPPLLPVADELCSSLCLSHMGRARSDDAGGQQDGQREREAGGMDRRGQQERVDDCESGQFRWLRPCGRHSGSCTWRRHRRGCCTVAQSMSVDSLSAQNATAGRCVEAEPDGQTADSQRQTDTETGRQRDGGHWIPQHQLSGVQRVVGGGSTLASKLS